MGYELSFYKIDLSKAEVKMAQDKPLNVSESNQVLFDVVELYGNYVDCIHHASGFGAQFQEYISSIASNYFCEPKLFEFMMARNDIFPFTNELEWGYLKHEEIERYLVSSLPKDKESYFNDNDDFEEDLDTLEEIFEVAVSERSDLICLYS